MDVHLNCKEVDQARARKVVESAQVEIVSNADANDNTPPEHTTEDINPDDIPF
jgi:hypothetical protein